MKERPILFSAPMVRAILAGRKTQTRRAVKPRKDVVFGCLMQPHELAGEVNSGIFENCPYGQPSDRLWVRENFQPLFADGIEKHWETDWKTGKGYSIRYPATDGVQEFFNLDDELSSSCKPSIHMPRWASRILLEITGVRVEKLKDISDSGASNDCTAEGVFHSGMDVPTYDQWHGDGFHSSEKWMYRKLWESINGTGSWDANPWVWVVEFKKLEGGAA